MTDPKPQDELPVRPAEKKQPNDCFLCGRSESGSWHYVASLGRFVCDECYRRAMSAERTSRPRA